MAKGAGGVGENAHGEAKGAQGLRPAGEKVQKCDQNEGLEGRRAVGDAVEGVLHDDGVEDLQRGDDDF